MLQMHHLPQLQLLILLESKCQRSQSASEEEIPL